jgi:hypothetical protein
MKLHQDQTILGAQQMRREGGRARIGRESAVRIQRRDCSEIGRELRKGVALLPESLDPVPILRGFERLLGPEVVATGAGMGFDVDQRFGFDQECLEQQCQKRMLEDVGVIAGVEPMKIT